MLMSVEVIHVSTELDVTTSCLAMSVDRVPSVTQDPHVKDVSTSSQWTGSHITSHVMGSIHQYTSSTSLILFLQGTHIVLTK